MAVARVQSVELGGTGTTLAPNIATPTQNNTLVSAIFTKTDTGCTNPSGMSTAIEVVNSTNADTLRISWKIAGAAEADPQWTALGSGDSSSAATYEISGADTSSPFDKSGSTAFTGGVTSLSSGSTGTLSLADEICIAAFGLRGIPTSPSFNNSFTLQHNVNDGSILEGTLLMGHLVVAATTAQSTTASWTGALGTMGAIATFKAPGGGGGPTGPPPGTLQLMGVGV